MNTTLATVATDTNTAPVALCPCTLAAAGVDGLCDACTAEASAHCDAGRWFPSAADIDAMALDAVEPETVECEACRGMGRHMDYTHRHPLGWRPPTCNVCEGAGVVVVMDADDESARYGVGDDEGELLARGIRC